MNLRTQLFLVSLLTLTLPWASCQYVREMEDVQRTIQKNSLQSTAETIAHTIPPGLNLDPFLSRKRSSPSDTYAFRLTATPTMDGYANDWGLSEDHIRVFRPISADHDLVVRSLVARDNNYIYVHLSVMDNEVVYPNATGAQGDEVLVNVLAPDYTHNRYTVNTIAPGPISVSIRGESPANRRLSGFWQETSAGYNVELRLPIRDVGIRLGFLVKDVDGDGSTFYLGSLAPTGTAIGSNLEGLPNFLRSTSDTLEDNLEVFIDSNLRIRVIDTGGWELADLGSVAWPTATDEGLQQSIYRRIINPASTSFSLSEQPGRLSTHFLDRALTGQSTSIWQPVSRRNGALVSTAVPIQDGTETTAALVLEKAHPDVLLLAEQDSVSFLNRSILITLGVGLVLLAYASYLSLRIRRLKEATDRAVSQDGQLRSDFSPSEKTDELGDLSRTFGTLLERVREYTNYLEALAGRLSHEMRTPLTVVRSSLDNLTSMDLDPEANDFTHRARDGVDRLASILSAMTEARRLEQSIRDHELVRFDVTELLRQNALAFQQIHQEHKFVMDIKPESHTLYGSPELISQLLDKLVNNAVDFCDEEKLIGIESSVRDSVFSLSVWNHGGPLPNTMTGRLFDSMVSIREKESRGGHLGLGLHVAKMIVEFHGGKIRAQNLEANAGASFTATLTDVTPDQTNPIEG